MSNEPVVDTSVLPAELRERDQWVCWREEKRDGKPTKVPVVPEQGGFASSTDPETWSNFNTAFDYATNGNADGVGFVFTEDDDIVGVDLDDCHDPETGEADEVARDIIDRLDSYTEISPSGTGFHVLIEGSLPEGRNRRGSVELYETARFFTVTGDYVEGTPTQVARRQDALEAIHRDYVQDLGSDNREEQHAETVERGHVDAAPSIAVDLEDEELLTKARQASNGEKFERLWNGNTAGYDSQSEADMALCCLLAFWTGGESARIDELFRQSGLYRGKWDEVHYADGATYGEKTVSRSIETASEFYDPDASSSSVSTPSTASTNSHQHGAPARTRAYLAEKNRLLTERVTELEATLELKSERIATLETELSRVRSPGTDPSLVSDSSPGREGSDR